MSEENEIVTEEEGKEERLAAAMESIGMSTEDASGEEHQEVEATGEAEPEPEEETAETPEEEGGAEEETKKPEEEGEETEAVEEEDETADMKPATAERFKTLKENYNTIKEEADTYKSQVEDYQQILNHSGADNNQFLELIEYSHNITSGDPVKLNLALEQLDRQRENLARRLGREVPGVDLLSDHPDLKERVGSFDIHRDDAVALVAARNRQKQEQEHYQAQQNQIAAENEARRHTESAMQAISQMEHLWASSDADYKLKQKPLIDFAVSLQQSGIPPSQWAGLVDNQYKILTSAMTTATAAAKPAQTPPTLRPRSGGGGSQKPKNAAELAWQTYETMNGL